MGVLFYSLHLKVFAMQLCVSLFFDASVFHFIDNLFVARSSEGSNRKLLNAFN
jgi:hypothetical protein